MRQTDKWDLRRTSRGSLRGKFTVKLGTSNRILWIWVSERHLDRDRLREIYWQLRAQFLRHLHYLSRKVILLKPQAIYVLWIKRENILSKMHCVRCSILRIFPSPSQIFRLLFLYCTNLNLSFKHRSKYLRLKEKESILSIFNIRFATSMLNLWKFLVSLRIYDSFSHFVCQFQLNVSIKCLDAKRSFRLEATPIFAVRNGKLHLRVIKHSTPVVNSRPM